MDVVETVVAIFWSEESEFAARRFPLYPIMAAITEATERGCVREREGARMRFWMFKRFGGG